MDKPIYGAAALQLPSLNVTTNHGTFYRVFDVHFADGSAKHTLVPLNVQNGVTSNSDRKEGVTLQNVILQSCDTSTTSPVKFVMNPAYNSILNEQNNLSKGKRWSASNYSNQSSAPSDAEDFWVEENCPTKVQDLDDDQLHFDAQDYVDTEDITILVDPRSYIYPDDESDYRDTSSLRTLLEMPDANQPKDQHLTKVPLNHRERPNNGQLSTVMSDGQQRAKSEVMSGDRNYGRQTECKTEFQFDPNSWIKDMQVKLSSLATNSIVKNQTFGFARNSYTTAPRRQLAERNLDAKKCSCVLCFNADDYKKRPGNVKSNSPLKRRKAKAKTVSRLKPDSNVVLQRCSVVLQKIHPLYLRCRAIDLQTVSERMLYDPLCEDKAPVRSAEQGIKPRIRKHYGKTNENVDITDGGPTTLTIQTTLPDIVHQAANDEVQCLEMATDLRQLNPAMLDSGLRKSEDVVDCSESEFNAD